MKITAALISDVHGNFEALKAVLSEIDRMGIKEIFCLGDIAGYYSQINECCEELRNRRAECVLGNHDWYMVSGSFCPRSKSVNDCLDYQRKVITKENKDWLASFPLIRYKHGISMVHGSWSNPIDDYLQPEKDYFIRLNGKFFASGHCHIQRIENFGNKIYCNPGSIGQPRDNNPSAAFAVFDGEMFHAFRTEYDIQKTCSLMDEAGFNPYYYGCLKDGAKNLHC